MNVENHEVTIRGASPIILLPLGTFSDRPETEELQYERALKFYRRNDGEGGFPAGGIKNAVQEVCSGFNAETKARIIGGFHVVGEAETNMVKLIGKPKMEKFDFQFKKPARTITLPLPRIEEWYCIFPLQILSDLMKRDEFKLLLEDAGRRIGIGHRRPEMGRFEVAKIVPRTNGNGNGRK